MESTRVALIVGPTVAGMGLLIVVASLLGRMTPEPGVPRWLPAWVGGVFLLGGGVVSGRAMRRVLWKQRARRYAEAWRRDYPWPLRYMADDSGRALRYQAGGLLLFAAFIGIFNALLFSGLIPFHHLLEGNNWVPVFVIAAFDLAFVLLSVFLVYRLLQRWRFGRARFYFEEGPPYYLGGELVGTFVGHPKLAQATCAEAVLRAVEEYLLRSPDGTSSQVMRAVYEDRAPLEIDAGGMAHIRFPLPAGGPATCLSNVPTRYWELVVRARFPGPDYEGIFLVPVYAPPPYNSGYRNSGCAQAFR